MSIGVNLHQLKQIIDGEQRAYGQTSAPLFIGHYGNAARERSDSI